MKKTTGSSAHTIDPVVSRDHRGGVDQIFPRDAKLEEKLIHVLPESKSLVRKKIKRRGSSNRAFQTETKPSRGANALPRDHRSPNDAVGRILFNFKSKAYSAAGEYT